MNPPVPSVVPSSNCSVTLDRSVLASEDPSAAALSALPAQMSTTRVLSITVAETGLVPVVEVANFQLLPPIWNGSPVVGQPRTANIIP
jgi:hypothetical protein